MGSAIAERLQDAGAELHPFDPNEAALALFVAKGARVSCL
jgi:3-hydroxyisobutyrate dehydrogenase-like beta-hydroxyacid dehydrogenase